MKLKINIGDKVQVIAGASKGQEGTVLNIDSSKLKICVKDVHVQTHFEKDKFLKKEGFIDYSNVKLIEKKKY